MNAWTVIRAIVRLLFAQVRGELEQRRDERRRVGASGGKEKRDAR